MMRRVLNMTGVAIAAIVMMSTPSMARTLDEIVKDGTIRIAVHPNTPPLSAIDPANNWSGFDIDIGKLLAERLGVKAEFISTQVPDRITYLVSDRVDISLGALVRTPDRMKVIDFSVPLHTENTAVLSTDKHKDKKSYMDFNDEKYTIVSCRGCSGVKFIQDNAPKAQLLLVDDTANIVRAIAQGRADAAFAVLDFYPVIMKNFPETKWHVLPTIIRTLYDPIGVKKGNDSVRHWLNAFLYDIQSQGIHNQLWEKNYGSPPIVPVVPQPYW